MKENIKKGKGRLNAICVMLVMTLLILTGCGSLSVKYDIDKVIENTAEVITESAPVIVSGSIGGEFALKGLVESGINIDSEIGEDYYTNLEQVIKANKGILSDYKYTEYARAAIGVLAIGKDPQNVAGYNLITPLDDYKIVNNQGVNAESYAILAARMAGVKLSNEDRYVENLVNDIKIAQKEKRENYTDYVAIELLGLSLIEEKTEEIDEAVKLAKEYLSSCQKDDGSMGNSDSTSITIIGLTQVGVDIFEDQQFIKNEKTLADGLMNYCLEDGGFGHRNNEQYNQMSTESALLALDAVKKSMNGEKLYQ